MDYVVRLITKYPWLSEEDAEEIVDKARMFYHSIVYKNDVSIFDYNMDMPRQQAWMVACCDEIVERAGCSSATAYRENGLQINFDNSQISLGLINMLSPVVGVIKR